MGQQPKDRPKEMTVVDALVIADEKGNYYVVPREHLELSKVSPIAKEHVEAQLKQRRGESMPLSGGFSFEGVITLAEDTNWKHYSPDIAWPH